MDQALPADVASYVTGIENAIELTPTAEQVPGGWRVTLSTDRVALVINFATNKINGRTRYIDSTLHVDGESRPLADDAKHLAEIIRNPDGVPAVPDPMPVSGDYADAPPLVQHQYRLIANKLSEAGVQLGSSGPGRWTIGLGGPVASLRVHFRRLGPHWHHSIQVIIGGIDRSRETNGDIASALALLAGIDMQPDSEARPSINQPAPAKRTNSVEVRRATVIRN